MAANKKINLGKIALILNGIPDSKQDLIENDTNTVTHNMIQPNHLGAFNNIQGVSVITRQSPVGENYFIQDNDILLKRLNPDNVTLINRALLNTTFSSNLFIVRMQEGYYPAFIACLLEKQGMAWLNSNIVGSITAVRSISIKALAELEIPKINIRKQKAIGNMWLLHKKRLKLLNQLKAEDQSLMTAVISSIVSGAEEEE